MRDHPKVPQFLSDEQVRALKASMAKTPRIRTMSPEQVEAINAAMKKITDEIVRSFAGLHRAVEQAGRSLAEVAKSTRSDYERRA